MPPPSPRLTRLEAERAARAAAAKSPPPEDSLSELEALKAKFDEVKRERDEAMAKVSELTDELEAATYSEEQVRALLAEARAELAERDDGDGEEAESEIAEAEVESEDGDGSGAAKNALNFAALTGAAAAQNAFDATPGALAARAEAAGAAALGLSLEEMRSTGMSIPRHVQIAGADGVWAEAHLIEKVDAHSSRVELETHDREAR